MAVRPGRDMKAPFVTGGNPDTVNDSPVTSTTVGAAYDLSGQLGALYKSPDGSGKEYIYVKFSSTSTGTAPAINQPCYWIANSTANLASPGNWVVDNNTTANTGASNWGMAGVLRVAATRGNYVWLLRKSGSNFIPIAGTTTIANLGDPVVSSSSSSASVTVISSTSTVLGTAPAVIGQLRWGVVASTATAPTFVGSTATGGLGVNVAIFLDVE